MIKITERSLYPLIIQFLEKELNAKGVAEAKVGDGFVDIFFKIDSSPFIAEIKFGGEREYAEALSQVYDYAMEYGTKNVVVCVLPSNLKGQAILDISKLYDAILSQKIVVGWIHTDYWSEHVFNVELKKVFKELEERFRTKIRKIDFNSIVSAIRENVKDLYSVIRQAKTGEIFEEVATKLELFAGLSEIKKSKEMEAQVSMLASYLLFNQLLFYHVYRSRTNDERLPELNPIKSIKELKGYFSKILEIDYQPIYEMNLVDKIPERIETIQLINRVIKNLVLLRAEYITQDLAGRFFHALLPKEVAKVWAAFYTNPIAAEILASLAIDRWDETVIDPACGSGTLLAAAYRRKLSLYEEQTGNKLDEETLKKLHKKFLEEDITGIDIMPFAAHLTTINLASQRIDQPTNVVRVARMDSLELAQQLVLPEFKQKGISLKPFTEEIQKTLGKGQFTVKKKSILVPSGKGKEFSIGPVDVVIMNPPFSDRDKLPSYYREKLKKLSELGRICGHQINLWGYFLALADLLLKPNGKIAAVLPINIARGKATEKIRNHLLKNYHIKYIIKTTKDIAFSESAAFRDILLIAEKRKPKEDDVTNIIFLKKSVKEFREEEVKDILNPEKRSSEVRTVKYSELLKYRDNLMPLITNEGLLNLFKMFKKFEKLEPFDIDKIDIGLPYRPRGVANGVFITRPSDKSRIKDVEVILLEEKPDSLVVGIKNIPKDKFFYELEKEYVKPALRTITGIKKLTISDKGVDYVLVKKHVEYWKALRNFGIEISGEFFKTKPRIDEKTAWEIHSNTNIKEEVYLVIPRKINLISPNTYLVSIFSEKGLNCVGPSLWSLNHVSKEEAKILNLYFNSIVSIVQIMLVKSETLGAYFEILKSDWKQFKVLSIKSLTEIEKKNLLDLFEKLKDVEFPSILEQLEKRFWARVELDKTILKILGFSDKEIEEWLPQIYDAVLEELKAMKNIK